MRLLRRTYCGCLEAAGVKPVAGVCVLCALFAVAVSLWGCAIGEKKETKEQRKLRRAITTAQTAVSIARSAAFVNRVVMKIPAQAPARSMIIVSTKTGKTERKWDMPDDCTVEIKKEIVFYPDGKVEGGIRKAIIIRNADNSLQAVISINPLGELVY